jgi:Tol biopolymer transport system component
MRRDLELYLIDNDGSNPVQLTFTTPPAFNQMASWSPDGQQLAFLSTRDGCYSSVFITDAEGNNQINLTPKPATVPASMWSSRAPGWWRNGQHLYFTGLRSETGANEQNFVMNADGSGVTPLTLTPGASAEAALR